MLSLISSGITSAFVAHFAFFIALLLIGTLGAGKILNKLFRIPIIAGQIIGGIMVGPSVLNIAGWSLFVQPFNVVDQATGLSYGIPSSDLFVFFVLLLSAVCTVAYLLWLAGYETDINDMIKVGGTAVIAGVLGAVVPIFFIALAALVFINACALATAIGIGVIFAATSVSIPVAMLVAQKKMHLRTSKATLGAAIIDDILAIVLLSMFLILLQTGFFGDCFAAANVEHVGSISTALIKICLAFIAFFAAGLLIVPTVIHFLHKRRLFSLIAPVAFCIMLFFFSFAELIGGLAGITGAYFAGLFQRRVDVRHYAEKALSPFINAVLLPLFLCSIGLQVDISLLTFHDWLIVLGLLIVAIIAKFVGVYCATELSNLVFNQPRWSLLEGYIFGASMVARGEVGLVVATILRGTHIISPSLYVISVVVIVLTTIAAPIMLSLGFSWQKSNPGLSQQGELTVQLGRFTVIGTQQMFNIIIDVLEKDKQFGTTILLAEGHSVVHLEKAKVEIILSPQEGITLKGDPQAVERLLLLVKIAIQGDIAQLPAQQV